MQAKIKVNRNFIIDKVDPRIFGGFIEHIGRAVYEGIFEPEHPKADNEGLRSDVLELVRELNMPVTRYPGGNFVSAYNWEDGVGPQEKRPKKLDFAWKSLEPNLFGTNDFINWCKKAGTAPMFVVNLGTRGPVEAQALVEYCNHSDNSHWSDLRRSHGWEQPHGVKVWCLGNEMDGLWQAGHKNAEDYGKIALEAGKMMKNTDPSIELVVCGSSNMRMSTFATWEATVLEYTFDIVDYISLHAYYNNDTGNTLDFLAKSELMDKYIKRVISVCDYIAAIKHSNKKMMLSFDEWNVWYQNNNNLEGSEEWTVARNIVENIYNMEDALVVGSMLITLLNNVDRVKMACIAQTVNVIAPIMTTKGGGAWRQTTYFPFQLTSKYGQGIVLEQLIDSPHYNSKLENDTITQVPYLTSSVIYNKDTEEIVIFAVNRNLEEDMQLSVELEEFGPVRMLEWLTMHNPDLKVCNSENNEHVVPIAADGVTIEANCLKADLPKASWNMVRLKVYQAQEAF